MNRIQRTSQQDHESENPEHAMAASVKPLLAEEETHDDGTPIS